jgi:hypothetical protein
MRLKVFASKPLWGVVGMLKKYVAKFAMDILPSVAATIIGAYIVNHYIVTKPGAGAPVTAAVSIAEPSPEAKAPAKAASKPSERSSDLANLPEAGAKAKGIAEKSILDKPTSEKPADKSADKPADKSSETASLPVETRRHQPASREKTAPKPIPPAQSSASQPSSSAMVSGGTTPNTIPPAEASVAPDANDLARAAIERLRGANDGSSRAQEAARIPDAPHVVSASPVSAPLAAPLMGLPPVRPLPPPIMVSTPSGEMLDPTGSSQMKPPYAAARVDDPSRPTPPADIPSSPSSPSSRPLDLRAEASGPSTREHTNVAEDVLSAAKSVFHAVLPNSSSK